MDVQNSVFGFITEQNTDTLTEICDMLKFDENRVAAEKGHQ